MPSKVTVYESIKKFLYNMHSQIQIINSSKIFAGLIIIVLNISSKFVTIKLSKTMESYLKYTFSKQILVFAMAWMGTRDIYIALFITFLFTICIEYLFNEESTLCCLPQNFKDYHLSLLEENSTEKVTEEDVKKAESILEKAKAQKTQSQLNVESDNNKKDYNNILGNPIPMSNY